LWLTLLLKRALIEMVVQLGIGVARMGGQRGHALQQFLENIVILCFEKRFSNQNSVIRLKSNTLAPPNFWAGYATAAWQ